MKPFHEWISDMAGSIEDHSAITTGDNKAEPQSEAYTEEDERQWELDLKALEQSFEDTVRNYTYTHPDPNINPWKPIIMGDD